MSDAFWRAGESHVVVDVRLTPKGGRDAVEGVRVLADGRAVLTARVRAAPEKGAANAALEVLMADALGVPKSAATVIAGGTSRLKQVRIEGDAATLGARLSALAR